MGIVSDFVKGVSGAGMSALGTESFSIDGGAVLSAVLNEDESSRDFETGGHDNERTLKAVIPSAEWDAGYASASREYLGKPASARGVAYVVAGISKGISFVEVELSDEEAAR